MDIGIAEPAWGGAGEDTPPIALAGFEGPLALLVDLARSHRVDLSALSVAAVVDQVMAALCVQASRYARLGSAPKLVAL